MVKVNERRFVAVDPDKCSGCQTCEYICSYTKEKAFNPTKSRIRVERQNQIINMPVTCRLCEEPACVAACPRDALKQSEDTGIKRQKQRLRLVHRSHYGAMMLHPEAKIVFACDLCKDKPEGPQCIKMCPQKALACVTSDALAQKARISAIKRLFADAK